MTENKRFQWIYIKDNILELRDNGIVKVFNNERLEELLNEFAEENEQLKQELATFYEVWYEFYDGTQANFGGYHKKMFSYLDKQKAEQKLEELKKDGEIYYIKEVKLDD